jgi:hypothetical protein
MWTDSQGLPDGDYSLVVAGYSTTGATANRQISVTLDNTPPTAEIASPGSCEVLDGMVEIEGTAFDANIDDWELRYFDPFTHNWKYINDDSDNVTGSLGTWDTSELTPCFYMLRLRVRDRAIVHNCADRDPHVTDFYLPVAVGRGGETDLDFDGDTDLVDFALFQAGFTGPLP